MGTVVVVSSRLLKRFLQVWVEPDLEKFGMLVHPFGVANSISGTNNLGISCLQVFPFIELGIEVPNCSFEDEGANLEALVRVQADGTFFQGSGVCPIEQVGIWFQRGPVFRKPNGFVFYNFSVVKFSESLLVQRDDLHCHK